MNAIFYGFGGMGRISKVTMTKITMRLNSSRENNILILRITRSGKVDQLEIICNFLGIYLSPGKVQNTEI